jgi:hypothetical protein
MPHRSGQRGECLSYMGLTKDEAAERLAVALEAIGCEVDREKKEYRVLMFRRNKRPWSQVHESLNEWRFRVSGPEKHLAFGLGAFKNVYKEIIEARGN